MILLRPGRDEDAPGIIALIGACWAEHPGCVLDVDGEVPELRTLASHYRAKGGRLWVAGRDGALAGMVAVTPAGGGTWELGRMYVARRDRGTGLAQALLAAAAAHAAASGATRLELWTDTRFERAHRFYAKAGFVRSGPIRALDDIARTLEYRYHKPLGPCVVERLDAAGAASAEPALAAILCECVAAGAAVSFLAPLDPEKARRFWRGVASEAAQANRMLFAAWSDGRLAGTVQLVLAMPENQPHRAEIAKLLVAPWARRRGLARALMLAAQAGAAASGRTLLTLDTRAGHPGEALYRALGWHEAGRIPDYALEADGALHDTILFWRRADPPGS